MTILSKADLMLRLARRISIFYFKETNINFTDFSEIHENTSLVVGEDIDHLLNKFNLNSLRTFS